MNDKLNQNDIDHSIWKPFKTVNAPYLTIHVYTNIKNHDNHWDSYLVHIETMEEGRINMCGTSDNNVICFTINGNYEFNEFFRWQNDEYDAIEVIDHTV